MALDTSDPNAVRQAAHDILSQSQFTSQRQSAWERVIYYITHPLDALTAAFDWVASKFFDSASNAIFASIIAAVIAAVIIFLIVRFGRSTRRNNSVRVHYAPEISGKSTKDLWAEGDQLERDEKWRESIRVRYSALIQALNDDGIVRARSGRTTGEYLAEVNVGAPGIADEFARATRIFEWVWYGKGEPGRDEALEFKMLARSATQKAAA